MMLALEADLVATGNFAPGYLGPVGEAELKLLFEKGMRALSSNGVLGDPRKASAARGRSTSRHLPISSSRRSRPSPFTDHRKGRG